MLRKFKFNFVTGVYTWNHFKAVYLTTYGQGVRKHTLLYKLLKPFRKYG